ncbi:MAG: TIGR00725 family protein [Elusimicrobia bacterium RIFOXYD2_FULL_34_15]|nr:MAG: TIGR00725 family protein [Elusimicrobia bacterium RIFOXYD2_FULL_34_15]
MLIGIIGGSKCNKKTEKLAEEVGSEIAKRRHTLVCGGMGGVMEAVCRGAKKAGGLTIGILPGKSKEDANKYIDIPIVTAMSHARNAIIVRTADIVIAISGSYGTLSEIGLAKSIDKTVIGLNTWDIPGIIKVDSVEELIKEIKKAGNSVSGNTVSCILYPEY